MQFKAPFTQYDCQTHTIVCCNFHALMSSEKHTFQKTMPLKADKEDLEEFRRRPGKSK